MATARIGSTELFNVHDEKVCAGRPCVVHAQSAHHMRDWPLTWNVPRMLAERMCPHGQLHPDVDDRNWRPVDLICAGCDGCCGPPPMPTVDEAVQELLAIARDLQD